MSKQAFRMQLLVSLNWLFDAYYIPGQDENQPIINSP